MSARLNYLSLFEDHNPVRVLDRRKTMGDDDGRATLGCPIEGSLHNLFTADVDGARGFVENQDRRLLDD